MEDWTEDAARQLERITGDPLADAVAGRVRVVSRSEPGGRGRYQPCTIELLAEAEGVPPRTVTTEVVFDRRHWPPVGAVLPARVSRTHPDAVEVNWDALARG
jgi:hypothetical protein